MRSKLAFSTSTGTSLPKTSSLARTLPRVGVVHHVGLLDQRGIDITAKGGFINVYLGYLCALHVIDGDIHLSFTSP